MEAATRLVINFELIDKATAEATRNLRAIETQSKKTNAETKKAFQDSEQSLKSFERGLNSVSRSTAVLSAAIIGPLSLAVNHASKENFALYSSLNQIKDATDQVIQSIGVSMIPVMQTVAQKVREASDWWRGLSQEQKDSVIQTAAWTAGILAAVAASTKIVAALVKLGALVAAPGGQIAIGMAAFVTTTAILVDKWAKLNGEILTFSQRWDRIRQTAIGLIQPGVGAGQLAANVGMGIGQRFGRRVAGAPEEEPTRLPAVTVTANKSSETKKTLDDLGAHATKVADEIGNRFAIMADTYMRSLGGIAGVTMTVIQTTIDGVTKGLGDSVAQAIVYGKDFSESMQAALKSLAAQIISFLVSTIAKIVVLRAMGVVGPISTAALGMGGGQGGGAASGGSGGGGIGGFFKSIFGFAKGGMISEPVVGVGLQSGSGYAIGERGPEMVTPMTGGARMAGGGNTMHFEIHNPVIRSTEDIDALAEAISRKFAREARRA